MFVQPESQPGFAICLSLFVKPNLHKANGSGSLLLSVGANFVC